MKRKSSLFALPVLLFLSACAGMDSSSHSTLEAATQTAGQANRVTLTSSLTPTPTATITPTVNPWTEGNPGVIQNVKDVACNAPCTLIAVAADQGVFLLEGDDLSPTGFIHAEGAYSVEFSPDDARLAVGEGSITLFDLATIQPVAEFTTLGFNDLAFSPDGRLLAAAYGNDVSLWDVDSESRIAILEHNLTLTGFEGHTGMINQVSFSPDGSTLFTTNILPKEFEDSISWHASEMSMTERRAYLNEYAASPLSKVCAWSFDETSNLLSIFPGIAAINSTDGRNLISIPGGVYGKLEYRPFSDFSHPEIVEDVPSWNWSDLADLAVSDDGSKVAIAFWSGETTDCDLVLSVWTTTTWEQDWEYCYTVSSGTYELLPGEGLDKIRLNRGILFTREGDSILYWARGNLVAIDTSTGEEVDQISTP